MATAEDQRRALSSLYSAALIAGQSEASDEAIREAFEAGLACARRGQETLRRSQEVLRIVRQRYGLDSEAHEPV